MFLFSAVLTQEFCWLVCKLLTFLNSIFPRILFLFLIITSTFLIREWENFSFSGCPCPPCPCPPDRIEEEGGREKYLQNKFPFEGVGRWVSQKWNFYFDPPLRCSLLQRLPIIQPIFYRKVLKVSTPIRTLYLQIPQWILFSIHIVPQQNLLAENAYGGRLWWVGILVGG